MASIKERAAALNLAEKLRARCCRGELGDQAALRPGPGREIHRRRCVTCERCPWGSRAAVAFLPARGGSGEPMLPASAWRGLVSHLRGSVTVKRRRVRLKTHSDCFLGSEAVDAVAAHFSRVEGFEENTGVSVSRDTAVCVCQALLDCSVFESVGAGVFGNDKKQDEFQDCKSALYRFVNVHTPSADELERVLLANGVRKLFCHPPSDGPKDQTCSSGSSDQMSTPVGFTETATKANQLDTPVTGSLSVQPVLDGRSGSPSREQTDPAVPQSLVDELWQEQTLLRLLNLVELPVLEGILQCSQTSSSPLPSHRHNNQDLTHSSNHLDRQILRAFRDTQEDEWLRAALDCLDFLPDQPVVELSRELPHCCPQYHESCCPVPADGSAQDVTQSGAGHDGDYSQRGLVQCKLLLYGTLVKHYSQADRPPLLPQNMTDVYTAIADLLVNAMLSTALEALQLCLKLLPRSCREELRRLLTFMSLAANPQGIKLDKEMENRLTVKRAFSRAVVHNKSLSKEKEDMMVVFMLCNVEEIFKIPGALHKGVSDKLVSLVDGKLPDVTGSMFCQQVSSRNYTGLIKETTNQELWALLKGIHLDTKISEKERKRLLRQFYGSHPEIFNKYFGDSAVSVL